MKTYKPWVLTAAALLILTACGGGGDESVVTPPVAPPIELPVSSGPDRIEPFDTSVNTAATTKDKAASTATRGIAPAAALRRVALAALAAPGQHTTTKATAAAVPGVAMQVGVARNVGDTASVDATQALLRWQPTDHDTQVAALAFDAAGAHGVRLGVLVRSLPEGAVLRFYGADPARAVEVTAQEIAAIARRNAQGGADAAAARTYWSPDFAGPSTTLEIEIPAAVPRMAVQLAVPRLSHFTIATESLEGAFTAKVGESGSCNVDATCRPELSSESRSVARMLFVREDGGTFLCTGTLLNDSRSSGISHFLSANHCFSTQAVASTLTTDWFYRSAACNTSTVNPGTIRVTGGATLLYASTTTDTAFMRLNSPPPTGVVYAGSYFGNVAVQTPVVGVHHPAGDLQKASVGTVQRHSVCAATRCEGSTPDNGTFLTTTWQQGSTEGGSSGSAIFMGIGNRRYVVGQLLGGTASCEEPNNPDHYGRFDKPYRSNLRQWLSPGTNS